MKCNEKLSSHKIIFAAYRPSINRILSNKLRRFYDHGVCKSTV